MLWPHQSEINSQGREGVTLNRMVGEHPLSCREPSSQAVGQSSGALHQSIERS